MRETRIEKSSSVFVRFREEGRFLEGNKTTVLTESPLEKREKSREVGKYKTLEIRREMF